MLVDSIFLSENTFYHCYFYIIKLVQWLLALSIFQRKFFIELAFWGSKKGSEFISKMASLLCDMLYIIFNIV